MSVLQYTASDNPFDIFKLLLLSFNLQLLITSWPSLNFSCLSIYGFWLPLWHHQTIIFCPPIYGFLLSLWHQQTFFVFHRYTASDYPSDIITLLHIQTFVCRRFASWMFYCFYSWCPCGFWLPHYHLQIASVCPLMYCFRLHTIFKLFLFIELRHHITRHLQAFLVDFHFTAFDCHLQTVLSIIWFTDADYLLACSNISFLSFELSLLITPLATSNFSCLSFDLQLLITSLSFSNLFSALWVTAADYSLEFSNISCLSFNLWLLITDLAFSKLFTCDFL